MVRLTVDGPCTNGQVFVPRLEQPAGQIEYNSKVGSKNPTFP